jgi:dTDP-4-amino-4,6-dideoxygalactose transaminase
MINTDFSPWPCFAREESDAVSAVLLSNKVNYWTGQEGREFEKEFAATTDLKYASIGWINALFREIIK